MTTIRNDALELAATVADSYAATELAARDRLLVVEGNVEGALTRTRQAQTARAIAQSIRNLIRPE